MQEFQYSDAGLKLTESFEGLRLDAYDDSGGVLTIGYGHTGADVHWGQRITDAQAEVLLRSDLAAAVACVNQAVTAPIEQHQFDALVDFAFNAGRGNFLRSTLLAKLNLGDFAGAAGQFAEWINVNGQPCSGLVRRRAAEAAMFRGSPVS